MLSVSGRMRVADAGGEHHRRVRACHFGDPVMYKTAVSGFGTRSRLGREMPVVPCGEWRQARMREVALQIAPDARDVREVAGLPSRLAEAREDAEDLGVALRAERGIGEAECGLDRSPARASMQAAQ